MLREKHRIDQSGPSWASWQTAGTWHSKLLVTEPMHNVPACCRLCWAWFESLWTPGARAHWLQVLHFFIHYCKIDWSLFVNNVRDFTTVNSRDRVFIWYIHEIYESRTLNDSKVCAFVTYSVRNTDKVYYGTLAPQRYRHTLNTCDCTGMHISI